MEVKFVSSSAQLTGTNATVQSQHTAHGYFRSAQFCAGAQKARMLNTAECHIGHAQQILQKGYTLLEGSLGSMHRATILHSPTEMQIC